MNSSIVVRGSVQDIAQRQGQSLAETVMGVDLIVIVDCSGSMDAPDAPGGRTRCRLTAGEVWLKPGPLSHCLSIAEQHAEAHPTH